MKMKACSWMLVWGCVTLSGACGDAPRPPEVIDAHVPGEVALLIEREGGSGPYVASAAEHFRLVVPSGEVFKSVRWSANAGALAPDAERVTWTLPVEGAASLTVSAETASGKKAEGTFHFNVVAAPLAPSTVIDTSPDVTGKSCELAFDATGRGHAVYTNETRNSLWYATWDGTTWTTEQIDGPGLNNEGTFTLDPVLTVEPTGTPHVAYLEGAGQLSSAMKRLRYATRVGGVWVRENVSAQETNRVGIALDPSQSLRPVIIFSGSSLGSVRTATRTAANTWNIQQPAVGNVVLAGDPVFGVDGTLYVMTQQRISGVSTNFLSAIQGSAAESFRVKTPTVLTWYSMTWGPGSHLYSLANAAREGDWAAIDDITVNAPFSSSTVTASPVSYLYDAADLAYGGGKPVVALRRGTTLEVSTTDARGFWTYTQLGTVDQGASPSVAIRPTDGTAHVCYQQDGRVSFQ
ncbi:hypothetical protein ACLEPN_00230 [Myxococcus sp. 1LA]